MAQHSCRVCELMHPSTVYLISYGCSVSVSGPAAFRIAWGVQGIPGVVLGGAMFFFPESPRWLADRMTYPLLHLRNAIFRIGW